MEPYPDDAGAVTPAGDEPTPRGGSDLGEIRFLDIAALFARHLKALTLIPLGLALMLLVYGLVKGPDFEATSLFLPQTQDAGAMSRYAGLAAQFGVSLPMSGGESVSFYASLVRSRQLLEAVGSTTYHFKTDPEDGETLDGTLLTLYGVDGDTPQEAMNALVERLQEDITATTDPEAGLVQVTTVAPWAGLAEQVNRRVLDLVQVFNVEQRQSQARAQREFVQQRLKESEALLRDAESDLQEFMEQNRDLRSSPNLQFEQARLQRRVDLQQQLYLTLSQAFEQAKIDEVRDLPVITMVSEPEDSAVAQGSLAAKVVIGLAFGFVIALMYVLVGDFLRNQYRLNPTEMKDLVAAGRRSLGLKPKT